METLIVFGVFIMLSFCLGIVLGQKLNRGETIKVNPVEIVQDHIEDTKSKRKTQIEQEELDKMLKNIDNYNGSGIGQLDIRG